MGGPAAGSVANTGTTKKRSPSSSSSNDSRVAKKHNPSNSKGSGKSTHSACSMQVDQQTQERNLLGNNAFASLKDGDAGDPLANLKQPKGKKQPQDNELERKEKVPPIFVKGNLPELRKLLRERIASGTLKCTLRLCNDGVKLQADTKPHFYRIVDFLEKGKYEYYTHDIPSDKPLKVVLRGLDDAKVEEIENYLVESGLKPTNIFKIARQDKSRRYRDQLYLIHLQNGSISMKELKEVRIVNSTVVEWDRYKPVHRDITQCMNCLNFGHGTRNCHLIPRCNTCGENHENKMCSFNLVAEINNVPIQDKYIKCANCLENHRATSKSCPKRTEFINIRKKANTKNQPRRNNPPKIDLASFPELTPKKPGTDAPASASSSLVTPASSSFQWPSLPPPGFGRQQQEGAALPTEDDSPLYSMEQLVPIFNELATRLRSCKTRYEQVVTLGLFLLEKGY